MNEYFKVFSFNNIVSKVKSSDMIIQLSSIGNESTKLAIYDSLDSINQNEQDLFIDFKWEQSPIKTELIIKQDDPLYKGTGMYFIVFYDLKADYSSSLTVFNEADVKELFTLNCYTIPHLYSLNSLIFKINNKGFNYLHYTMATSNHLLNPLVLIKRGHPETGEVFRYYNLPSGSEYILLHNDITEYYIIITSEFTFYNDFNKHICIELLTSRVRLLSNETKFKRDFVFNTKFYFQVDIKDYVVQEENEFLLTLDNKSVYEAVDGFLCKYKSSKTRIKNDNDNNEISNFPFNEEENECSVNKDNNAVNTYHLFFKKNEAKIDILLITLQLRTSIVDKYSLNLRQLPRSSFIENEADMKINIDVPLYFKINLNTLQKNVVLYSSIKNCQSAIYGGLSLNKKSIPATYHNQMIVINTPKRIGKEYNDAESIVYIKFYSPNSKEQNRVLIKYIDQDIYYIGNDIRPQLSLPIKHNNCNEPVYFISINNQKSIGLISLETLYGKHETYHLHSFKSQDSIIEMLPNKHNADIVSSTLRIDSEIDMMQINCLSPLLLNVNMIKEDKERRKQKKGDSFRVYLRNEEELHIDLLIDKNIGIDVSIESDQSIIEVYLNNKKEAHLDKNNRSYRDLINVPDDKKESLIEYPISFTSISQEGSYIYVAFGNIDLFKVISESSKVIGQQNMLIPLTKEEEYKNVLINVGTNEEEISFCYIQGLAVLIDYVPLPKTNCHPIAKSFSLLLDNPYDKYNDSEINLGFYFVSITFNKTPVLPISIDITYTLQDKVDTIKEGDKFLLKNNTSKYRLGYSNDDMEGLLLFNINPCNNKKVEYAIEISGVSYLKKIIENKSTITVMNNYLVSSDVTFKDSNGLFYYHYVTEEDYRNYLPTSDYSIQQENSVNNYTFIFKPYVKALVQYDIYMIDTKEDNALPDECRLYSEKPFKSFEDEGINDVISHVVQFEGMEAGKYAIAIIATELSGLETSAMYDPIIIVIFIKGISYWVWFIVIILGVFLILAFIFIVMKCFKNQKMNNDIEEDTNLLSQII